MDGDKEMDGGEDTDGGRQPDNNDESTPDEGSQGIETMPFYGNRGGKGCLLQNFTLVSRTCM